MKVILKFYTLAGMLITFRNGVVAMTNETIKAVTRELEMGIL